MNFSEYYKKGLIKDYESKGLQVRILLGANKFNELQAILKKL